MNQSNVAIAIDLGGTKLACAYASADGKLSHETEEATGKEKPNENVVQQLMRVIAERLDNHPSVNGIGMSTAGRIDKQTGEIYNSPNIHDLKGVPLKRLLTDRFHTTISIANDAFSALAGEVRFGVAKDKKHAVILTLGTGVGGGVMIDHEMYRGATDFAGELGHMIIDRSSAYSDQANHRGCLEAFIGGGPLKNRGHDLKTLFQGASFFEEWIAALQTGIDNIKTILDPELIIIGGGVSREGRKLIDAINRPNVVLAELSQKAGLYGAAALVFSETNI